MEILNPGGIEVIYYNHLGKIMYELNLSFGDLERVTALSKSYIWKIERGECAPTLPVAYKICRALGYSIYDVFPEDGYRL